MRTFFVHNERAKAIYAANCSHKLMQIYAKPSIILTVFVSKYTKRAWRSSYIYI